MKTYKDIHKGINIEIDKNAEGQFELTINGSKFDDEGNPFMLEPSLTSAIVGARVLIDSGFFSANKNQ